MRTPGGPVHLALAFNPSHLEIVNPVVEGSVRARQHRRGDTRGDQVLPVLIHGDAAHRGAGRESWRRLNMAQTRGFYTGGTIHIVVNNQIGFTTSDPRDARDDAYCTDVAKMVEAPVLARERRRPGSRVCSRSRSRSSTGSGSTRTSSSTSSASAGSATTRPTSRR